MDDDTYSAQSIQDQRNGQDDDDLNEEEDVTSVLPVNVGNPGQVAPGDFTFGVDTREQQMGDSEPFSDTTNYQNIGEDISDKEGEGTARNIGDDDTGDDTTGRMGTDTLN